jgi:hypothetical protein
MLGLVVIVLGEFQVLVIMYPVLVALAFAPLADHVFPFVVIAFPLGMSGFLANHCLDQMAQHWYTS